MREYYHDPLFQSGLQMSPHGIIKHFAKQSYAKWDLALILPMMRFVILS
jgi:hypothetical protein